MIVKVLKKNLPLFKKQDKINYEVWGLDTFAHEYYLCGTFASKDAAEIVRDGNKKSAMETQDESLRDKFWIVETTDEKMLERQRTEVQIRYDKNNELSYSEAHLVGCVRELLALFRSSWETVNLEELIRNDGRKLKQEVNWNNEKDCFTQIQFETYYREDKTLGVGIGVTVRSGYYYGGNIFRIGSFSGSLPEMLQWAYTEKALGDCVEKFKDIIKSFRED